MVATLTDTATLAAPPPISNTAHNGRYTAIARSSIISTAKTVGVSRWFKRFRSVRTLAAMPDDEI